MDPQNWHESLLIGFKVDKILKNRIAESILERIKNDFFFESMEAGVF
jgi:hypothetical protein